MGDDLWKGFRSGKRNKRAANREESAALLRSAGIEFLSRNNDAHLIVTTQDGCVVDFWPGTGLWIARHSSQRHRGVRKLIDFCSSQGRRFDIEAAAMINAMASER